MKESKKQITIRVRKETADVLRNESRKIGGSNQYMGQVVDDLIADNDMNNSEVLRKLNEIEEKIENQTPPSTTATHTTKSNISDGLVRRIENGEPIDPEDFDLSQIKGTSKVLDVAKLVAKNETMMFQEDIDDLFRSDFGYSINSAREKRKRLMSELEEIPPKMRVDVWVDEEIKKGWQYAGNSKDKWISAHKNVADEEEWYKEQYAGSLEDYLTERVDMDFRPRYVHEDNLLRGLKIYRSILKHNIEYVDNDVVKYRLKNVKSQIQAEIDNIEK